MITLRPFQDQDAQQLIRWIYPNLLEQQALMLIREWKSEQYEGKFFQMLGVWKDEQLAGTVSLMETTKHAVSFGIQIHPNFRKQGIASQAGFLAMDHARRLGYQTMTSQVRQDNAASVALHEKLGFSLIGREVNRKGNTVNWCRLKLE